MLLSCVSAGNSLRFIDKTHVLQTRTVTDMKTPELYMLDPSGAGYRFHGCAAGKGANAAKTELEKILNRAGSEGISCRQAVTELGKMCVLSLQCKFVVAFIVLYACR
jgi:hypothetical protein